MNRWGFPIQTIDGASERPGLLSNNSTLLESNQSWAPRMCAVLADPPIAATTTVITDLMAPCVLFLIVIDGNFWHTCVNVHVWHFASLSSWDLICFGLRLFHEVGEPYSCLSSSYSHISLFNLYPVARWRLVHTPPSTVPLWDCNFCSVREEGQTGSLYRSTLVLWKEALMCRGLQKAEACKNHGSVATYTLWLQWVVLFSKVQVSVSLPFLSSQKH